MIKKILLFVCITFVLTSCVIKDCEMKYDDERKQCICVETGDEAEIDRTLYYNMSGLHG